MHLFVAELWARSLALVALSVIEVPTIIIDRVTRVSCTLYFLPNSIEWVQVTIFQRETNGGCLIWVLCASSTIPAHVQLTNGFVSTFGHDLSHTSFSRAPLFGVSGRTSRDKQLGSIIPLYSGFMYSLRVPCFSCVCVFVFLFACIRT